MKQELEKILKKHAQFELKTDYSWLDKNRQEVIKRLIPAVDNADIIYWKQASFEALSWREKFKNPTNDEEKLAKELVDINAGPYDRLNFYKAFLGDRKERLPGAGFYAEDLTQKEFEDYLKTHPEKKELLENQFTVIKRKGKELEAVWYHDEYKTEVQNIVKSMKDAANFAEDKSLKEYLLLRAEDLQRDEYYRSDCAWIDLKDPYLDFVIGPYEIYADHLMGLKTGYEAILMLKNRDETAKLSKYLGLLDDFEKNLPIDDKYKRSGAKLDTPMIVVDTIYRGGEARRAMQFVAFSLPNDPKVLSEKGSKKVMHKNFLDARFNKIISPVAKSILATEHHNQLNPDHFVAHVVMHEIAHSLGPRYVFGTKTPVNNALKEHYSPLEELRADILSIYLLDYMIEKGELSESLRNLYYVNYIASSFRCVRIGHGAYTVDATIMFNYMLDKGALVWKNNRLSINYGLFKAAVASLAKEVSMIEAEGNYKDACEMIEKYYRRSDLIKFIVEGVPDVASEIWPIYRI